MMRVKNMNCTRVLNIILLAALLFAFGCGTAGKNFDESLYKNIVAGTTTYNEVQSMFGSPFKKGVQNGYKVWTYEYNFYNALGKNITKDMVIVFDQSGVVKSHQMMTNQP
ncbi:MAG: hypothetical protein COW89_00095 [Nitrospinae bacterium CG22_combo_CG10-13_8_21_14_all_47_10]|nr:MAG: hypothetical protein COW89_00095 [Nitrospinae bacterium CG22_combo_CG10-13_8_21_14_all_47_10]